MNVQYHAPDRLPRRDSPADCVDVAVSILPPDDGSTDWWYCRKAVATLLRYGLLTVEFYDREAVA